MVTARNIITTVRLTRMDGRMLMLCKGVDLVSGVEAAGVSCESHAASLLKAAGSSCSSCLRLAIFVNFPILLQRLRMVHSIQSVT